MVKLADFVKTQSNVVSQKKNNYSKTNILDLCKKSNRGNVTLRIIADKNGSPMQTVKGLYQIYETLPRYDDKGLPVYNEDGTQATRFSVIEIPLPMNYESNNSIIGMVKPSEIQMNKLNNLISLINKYNEYIDDEYITKEETPTNMGIVYKSCLTTFWAKVFTLVPKGGSNIIEEPDIYLCRHLSGNFVNVFNGVCDQQIQLRGEDNAAYYLNKFASNDAGKYDAVISISSLLGEGNTVGYTVSISLMDGLKTYEITKEEIDKCEELSTVGWNFKQFDDTKVDKLTERLKANIDLIENKIAKENGALSFEIPSKPEGLDAVKENNNPFDSISSVGISQEETNSMIENESSNPFDKF